MKFEDLSSKIKQAEYNKIQYTAELQKMPDMIREIQEEIQKHKEVQSEQDQQILKYKKELGIDGDSEDEDDLDQSMQDSPRISIVKKRTKIINKKIKDMNIDIYNIDKQIKEAEKNVEDLKSQVEYKKAENKKEFFKNQESLDIEKRDLKEEIAKIKAGKLQQKKYLVEGNADTPHTENLAQQSDTAVNNLPKKQEMQEDFNKIIEEPEKKRILVKKSRVTKKDISFVAKSLAYYCKYNKLTYLDVFLNLERFIDGCPDVSVINMIEYLKGPDFDFKIKDPGDKKNPMYRFQESKYVETLARYIIEDNYEDKIYYNENATCQLVIVKSILKKLIGEYTLPTEEEEAEIH